MINQIKDIEHYLELIGQALDSNLGHSKTEVYAQSTGNSDWKICISFLPICNKINLIYYLDDYMLWEFKRNAKQKEIVVAHLATIVKAVKDFYDNLDIEEDSNTDFILSWNK